MSSDAPGPRGQQAHDTLKAALVTYLMAPKVHGSVATARLCDDAARNLLNGLEIAEQEDWRR